ncbi:hypothetical protein VPMG_00002 [Vibrio phage VBP32]|uniref:Band 7 domain-containing protein n=2 Tax=Stoningtonvirus VBP47 TaxID=2846606 RepID=M4SL11_9CAUD|nr:hypothetical protein VPNG_00013 [Vibrio phage VBP47]YP_007676492.1 hypothetical protein VPMG_00002 [Vibrio phage VBP32]AGH57037.1 hypothetical protein VPNG_00013 [Vibrio phage VBP47]AGH57141.1 hypothetical protein VPMG_00002 [Vibrio phage VBP32]
MNFQPKIKHFVIGGLVALGAITALSSFENVSAGEYVRVQKPSGSYTWYTEPGIKFKIPFFSTTTTYQELTTVTFSSSEETRDSASISEVPALIKFADGYTGNGEFTFRFRLSALEEDLEKMHKAVKRQSALQGNTLLPAADELLNQTANQFTGSGYAQGGKGEFKARLQDQAKKGMLTVKRIRQEVDAVVADQGKDDDRAQNNTAKVYEYVMEVQRDANGMPLRTPLDISQYGITIAQVTMGDFHESPELEQFLSDRRTKERESKNRIDEQRVERENAITAGLRGETKRIQAKNKALMIKDAAVIAEQQKVAVEREKANLSIVQKEKELAIAESNEGIQKANAAAAKYEAQAALEMGLAKAKITRANYQAIDKEVLRLEVQKATMLANARAYEKQGIQMPLIVGGGNGQSNPIQDMSSLKLLEQLGAPVNPTK